MAKKDINASPVAGIDRKSGIPTEFAMKYTDSSENKIRRGDIRPNKIQERSPPGTCLMPTLIHAKH